MTTKEFLENIIIIAIELIGALVAGIIRYQLQA